MYLYQYRYLESNCVYRHWYYTIINLAHIVYLLASSQRVKIRFDVHVFVWPFDFLDIILSTILVCWSNRLGPIRYHNQNNLFGCSIFKCIPPLSATISSSDSYYKINNSVVGLVFTYTEIWALLNLFIISNILFFVYRQ